MLNELLEDYQEYNEDEALDKFIKLLWTSKYGLRTYKKYYSFKIQPTALNNNKQLIELFQKYQSIELKYAKSYYKEKMTPIDMIRIHVNNMYMYLTDDEVYLPSEYYKQMKIPKQKYYETVKILKDGGEVSPKKLKIELDLAIQKAYDIKEERLKSKIKLSFKDYKELVNGYVLRLFNNYQTPEQYEEIHGWQMNVLNDAWHEDNYIVKYFCKSLTGYMMDYVKSLKYIDKKCKYCNDILLRKSRGDYCKKCYPLYRKDYKKKKQRIYRAVDN